MKHYEVFSFCAQISFSFSISFQLFFFFPERDHTSVWLWNIKSKVCFFIYLYIYTPKLYSFLLRECKKAFVFWSTTESRKILRLRGERGGGCLNVLWSLDHVSSTVFFFFFFFFFRDVSSLSLSLSTFCFRLSTV